MSARAAAGPHPAISGADRAAVMMMILGETQGSALLAQLDPAELRVLGERMCALGEIGPAAIVDAIGGFAAQAARTTLPAGDRPAQVQAMLARALGEVKATSLMQHIAPAAGRRGAMLDLARWLCPEALAPLIADEPPQAIAVLLVQLDPEAAAQVLHLLPEAVQTPVVHRIATLGPVPAEAVAMLEAILARRIGERHGPAPLLLGGVREAADILNAAARPLEKRIMPELARLDRHLARALEGEMFKFEHLLALDDKAMGALLREVESEALITALKGVAEPDREPFLRAMSSRAADGVREEIAARGRTRLAEVTEAQNAIVATARRLAAEGTIVFGASDDDYV